ncbi:MAG: ABC transporter permease [Actinomycetia bacterium]|nr:ABC transporter permease [Actinomycetes bacterium]
MDIIWEGIKQAVVLLFTGNREIYEILLMTIMVSGLSLLFSILIGIPLGIGIGLNKFPGKNLVTTIVNTGMSIPPVAVGLIITLMIWRSGPLGYLELMYTPAAMIIAQIIIASPIITGITAAAVQQISHKLIQQAQTLGANRTQMLWILLKEIKLAVLVAIAAGFGRAISEVGAVLIIGGNIKGKTRVLTTATIQMMRMGKFDVAIALVVILLLLSFGINFFINTIKRKEGISWMPGS